MSTLNTVNITNGTDSITVEGAVKGSAKAWVNFNGTGTVAIRASYNVSSITDNGTGSHTVNFTTAMPDANYSAIASCTEAQTRVSDGVAPTTTTLRISALSSAGLAIDPPYFSVAIFR